MKSLVIKITIITLTLIGVFNASMAIAAPDCSNPAGLSAKEQIQCGACDAAGSTTCDASTAPSSLTNTIKDVIDVISVIAGAIAVLMIIVGGLRYITSAGNAEGAKSARNTILYSVIGLIVIALAQIIVHFTLNTVAK
jgi:hypothetical protein